MTARELASDGSSAGADRSALPPNSSRHLERHRILASCPSFLPVTIRPRTFFDIGRLSVNS